jgi:hypothetical protein
MRWIKKGLIFSNTGQLGWSRNSALTPTPVMLEDKIRVYAGFRDDEGISRIGYVDLDPSDPKKILAVSKDPVLDIGEPGTFDDNGVILGDVVRDGANLRMYYVGFQLVKRAKFLAFTGLAISKDGGNSFTRVSNTPVLDRANGEHFIRAIHTAIPDEGKWKVWYASGNRWEMIGGKPFPFYNIYYTESADGIHFNNPATLCVDVAYPEYRIGRPRVYKLSDKKYILFFTKGTVQGDYLPGIALSEDGIHWTRKDEEIGISLSKEGWDSQTLCYPSLLPWKDKIYMFYNGNNMGADGFGYAELEGSL